jgi:hypothetical protein
MTLRQNKGGTVLTQFHEFAEARWRIGIETGAISMAETFTALRMLERATGQIPNAPDLDRLERFLTAQTSGYQGNSARAWTDLAHVVFNTKDFLYIR